MKKLGLELDSFKKIFMKPKILVVLQKRIIELVLALKIL